MVELQSGMYMWEQKNLVSTITKNKDNSMNILYIVVIRYSGNKNKKKKHSTVLY